MCFSVGKSSLQHRGLSLYPHCRSEELGNSRPQADLLWLSFPICSSLKERPEIFLDLLQSPMLNMLQVVVILIESVPSGYLYGGSLPNDPGGWKGRPVQESQVAMCIDPWIAKDLLCPESFQFLLVVEQYPFFISCFLRAPYIQGLAY